MLKRVWHCARSIAAVDKNQEKWAYVLQADFLRPAGSKRAELERYNKLSDAKVITEAALRSGIPKGAINAAWDAIGEVIKAWATEGHSVAVPGLGTMLLASPSLLRHGIAQASLALRMAQTQPSDCARRAWAT